MKVLFVNNFNGMDYQNDCVYFGLIENDLEVYETNYPSYLMSGFPGTSRLYGKGFTIGGKMTHTPKVESQEEILDKISSKFYDIVVYGSIWRDESFLSHVISNYEASRVHFIDGEDGIGIKENLIKSGVYWKRELSRDDLNPISFGIPVCQLTTNPPKKEKLFAHIVPGDLSTYIYDDEKSYYHDYAISYYGKTQKKAGWDCMRHYEILANRCIPYFPNLQDCPTQTMTTFPKEIILETNKFAEKNQIPPSYDKLNDELFDYTINNLTTKKLVERMFIA